MLRTLYLEREEQKAAVKVERRRVATKSKKQRNSLENDSNSSKKVSAVQMINVRRDVKVMRYATCKPTL